jgi:magnesium transporter
MFLSMKNTAAPIEIGDWDEQSLLCACLSEEEWCDSAERLGFPETVIPQYQEATRRAYTRVENTETYSFAVFRLPEVRDGKEHERFAALYLRPNCFVLVEPSGKNRHFADTFMQAMHALPAGATLERAVYAFFGMLLDQTDEALEKLEEQIETMSDLVMNNKTEQNFTQKLMRLKRRLLHRGNFCNSVIALAQKLQAEENTVFPNGKLHYLRLLAERSERQVACIASLREETAQIWEAYQSMTDLHLNRIMQFFTVISVIFLPLTLITGWYGMNFSGMSELSWEYGYPAVAILCIVVVLICLWIFKKKHWL